jgi:hypothetical protein
LVTKLKVDFSDVPLAEFQRLTSPTGRPYYRIEYDVEISVQSSLEFSVSSKGKKYGTVTASYDI